MGKPIKDFSIGEVQAIIDEAGLPSFRAMQILTWIYGRKAKSYDEMTDIPKVIREQFDLTFPLYSPEVVDKQVSVDGSRKYLIQFHDGSVVETVGLPSKDGRLSVCCSSQAGCTMNCAFCATGKQGLNRSLTPGEIADQVMLVEEDFGQPVTNVVIMGQGEPFANYDAVLAALRIMNHPKLMNIGARHITISTCGIIDGINKLAQEDEQFTLAVSLHAARQEVRDQIMPAMQNQRTGELRAALDAYANQTGRRFSLEYALMSDINDSEEDLQALISYAKRLLCHVNLIPLNEIQDSPFKPVSDEKFQYWLTSLEDAGIPVSRRVSRGTDIAGACGQLANRR